MPRSAQLYRQGDILLIRSRRPEGLLPPLPAENGRLILARGEATGHHHSVGADCATLNPDDGGVMYLTVEQLTEVVHQEHAPVPLTPGTYKVVRQREYTPAAIRNVQD